MTALDRETFEALVTAAREALFRAQRVASAASEDAAVEALDDAETMIRRALGVVRTGAGRVVRA